MNQYNGYPVVEVAKWAAVADYSSLLICLFGDMSMACTLGDRRGVTVKVDGSRYIDYDQLAVVGTTRFDFNVHDVGSASTAGPLVGLLGN